MIHGSVDYGSSKFQNHLNTDYRVQILRLLNDLAVKTESQDYIFYAYEHPVT